MRLLLGLTLAGLVAQAMAAQERASQPFKGGVELVQLDVAVLDAQRHPATGLTAADFTVLEDGKPQSIVSFHEVTAPEPDGSLVGWMRDVVPDVRTNAAEERRLFVVVIDDASIGADASSPDQIRRARRIAGAFIDRLGPLDQAAIVFTGNNRQTQEFTGDRARLREVVDGITETAIPRELALNYSAQTVARVAESLMNVSHRRKAMLYIGHGLRIDPNAAAPTPMGSSSLGIQTARRAREDALDALMRAQRANVTFYAFDPRGLVAPSDPVAGDSLRTLADATGGFAVVDTNGSDAELAQMFRETGSYYLLGFESGRTDGRFHRTEVKVNKSGLSVRTRSGYQAVKPETGKKPVSLLSKALTGVLPVPDVYLRAFAAPFASSALSLDGRTADVAIALGVRQPAPSERTIDTITVIASAYGPDGKAVADRKQTVRLGLRPSPDARAQYELLSLLTLKPGHYNLRIALTSAAMGKSGSVYTDVDVPQFGASPLTTSGLLLSIKEGLQAAPKDLLSGVAPVIPTTQREFAQSDTVTAFLRVYQAAQGRLMPVSVRATIRDESDRTVHDITTALDEAAFTAARAADVTLPLPLSRLAPGAYLLTLEAAGAGKTVTREVRFTIR